MSQWKTSIVSLRFCCAGICLVWLTISANSNLLAFQQLPGESEMPNRALGGEQLPDESKLPGASAVAAALLALPAESVLPPDSKSASIKEADLEIANQPDDEILADKDRPILKLQLNGPTGPVKAIQFTTDSKRILAGGDDKVLHVWSLFDDNNLEKSNWAYQQPINWQIYRGLRGSVRAIAVQPDWIHFAGHGATAGSGELALVEGGTLRLNRCLFDLEAGSTSPVTGLATTGQGRVAAVDLSGRISVWSRNAETGQWEAELIRQSDFNRFDANTSPVLERFRRFGTTLAASGNDFLVFAEPKPMEPEMSAPQWNLVRRSLETGQETILAAPSSHAGGIPAVGISADGNRIVSADLGDAGRFFIWDLARNQMATNSQMNAPVRTITVSPTGKFLLIGTANNASGESRVALWSWENDGFELLATWQHSSPILSSCISPDEKWLAYSVDNSVVVKSLDDPKRERPSLASNRIAINRVAFAASEENGYRIMLEKPGEEKPESRSVFDPQQSSLETDSDSKTEWVIANPNPGKWILQQIADARTGTLQWHVKIDGQRLSSIPLDSNVDGMITAACWLVDPKQPERPAGIAVGTNKRSHLYVFKLVADGPAALIRQYRGHESAINSVSVSFDRRYLVSASDDSTIRFWKLDDAINNVRESTLNDWGASVQVQANRLVVSEVVPDGPLYFRGMRAGDTIDAISWRAPNQPDEERMDDPDNMLELLKTSDYRQMLRFDYSRNAVPQSHFYLYPAWQPIASLVVTGDREWAFWSPYGYYNASFNGHKIFGWQFNRGIDQPTDYFRAAEMRGELERPTLMKKLLSAGSMEDAFLALRQSTPSNLHDKLAAENRLRPHIQITQPTADDSVRGNETIVEATVELPVGVQAVPPKAFANGVPAGLPQLIGKKEAGETVQYSYRWQLPLPGDRRIRIQVFAASQHGSADVAHVDVNHTQFDASDTRKLFLIAAGINRYSDSQIPQLEFAVNNVSAFKQVLGSDGQSLYDLDSTLLLETSANRPLWGVAAENIVDQIRETAGPDDLLVIFLSGHGVSDPASDQYYFVTSSSRYVDLLGRQYGDCIAMEDLAKFGEIPCRKLVILDTCESGAFRATGQHDLKPLVRALENDLFFTITASEGSANAYESKKDQLSFLTASLVRGMKGDADLPAFGGNGDRQVGFAELVSYVTSRVPAEISGIGGQQFPGAAPKELFGFAEIPLTVQGQGPNR